jgi:hypothetical protein
VIADGNDTPGRDPGTPGEGPGDLRSAARSEGDLLAERRARRAVESGETILVRRAEAAEATVATLERHVATLQHRLGEAEEEQRRLGELLDAEREAALEREHELRRVKQREYAEQQLRVEAEDRLLGAERESRAESEAIARRLDASEQSARELSERLQLLQRQLAEAEQAAAADGVLMRRAGRELEIRVSALEARTGELQRGLEAERAARERAEHMLEGMRQGHRQMEGLLGDVRRIVQRVVLAARAEPASPTTAAVEASAGPVRPTSPAQTRPGTAVAHGSLQRPAVSSEARGAEMSEALAAAVERLRARAEAAAATQQQQPQPDRVERPPHKHSMSLIRRLRNRRKQRRSR